MNTPLRVISLLPYKLKNGVKAAWCWQADCLATDPDAVVEFCVNNYINLFFVPYDTTEASDVQYKYFINQCTINGIDVHALYGTKEWALPAYRNHAINKINSVKVYNDIALPQERFKGIHFDVEAYLLNEWDNPAARTQLIRDWVDSMQIYKDVTRNAGMVFGAALPFWLDSSERIYGTAANNYTDATIPPEYSPKKLHEIFIDMVDYAAIMSYRNNTSVEYGSIQSFVQTEVNYAVNRKVIVSIETTNQNPSYITFYKEGYVTVERTVKIVDEYFKDNQGYYGIAIHDYNQYEKMRMEITDKDPIRLLQPTRLNLLLT